MVGIIYTWSVHLPYLAFGAVDEFGFTIALIYRLSGTGAVKRGEANQQDGTREETELNERKVNSNHMWFVISNNARVFR